MKGLSRYIRQVSSCLHCNKSERDYYASHITASLGEDAASLCYEEIVHRLGTPEEWVISQVENLNAGKVVLKSIHAYKKVRRIAIIITITLLIFLIGVIWFFLWDLRNRAGKTGHYSDPSVISTYIDPNDTSLLPYYSTEEVQP